MTEILPLDKIPGGYKSLGIFKTLKELDTHHKKWIKAKPKQSFLQAWFKQDGVLWYSLFTKTLKNEKKYGWKTFDSKGKEV